MQRFQNDTGQASVADALPSAAESRSFVPPVITGGVGSDIQELYQRAITGTGSVPYSYDFVAKAYTFMGEGIEALIGYPPEEVTPALWIKILQESVMLGKAGGLSKNEAAAEINAGRIKEWRCDMRVVTRFGKTRWISDASVQELNAEGKPISSVGILEDITERKQAEFFAVAFSNLGQGLSSTTTLHAAAQVIARVADEIFRWDACYMHLWDATSNTIVPVLTCDIIEGKRTEFTHSKPEIPSVSMMRVLRNGAELVLKEGMDPNATPYGDFSRPSLSIMRVPLRQRGTSIGSLALHSYSPQAYSQSDLNFLQTLADYCSGAFERIWAEETLQTLQKQLVETSRQAGMAEVATSVLHNVGNVLNSVNISASVIDDKTRNSKVANLTKAVTLMNAQPDLPDFLAHQPKGRELVGYLNLLSRHLLDEQDQILQETLSLSRDIQHIKEIVAMQQGYARVSGVSEQLNIIDLVEDAIRLNAASLQRHQVNLTRDYPETILATVDKHKVLQILVNLVRNAKYAVDTEETQEKKITVCAAVTPEGRVQIQVIDNGVGIPAENLTRIFGHGFTTRKDGHGFGLHSGALAAKEMGGALTVQSQGLGHGAAFTLEFPQAPVAA